MSGTFRSVVRPHKVNITTDLAGVLSFAQRATSFVFTSGQSEPLSSVTNTEHLIDSQLIEISNTGSSTILIAASLMNNNVPIDIEAGTVQVLLWTSAGKFIDVGGTANTRNLLEVVNISKGKTDTHKHTGAPNDYPKVRATDLDPVGGIAGDFFMLNGSGVPYWFDPLDGTAEQNYQVRNTDITTNLNGVNPVVVPLTGQVDLPNPYFAVSGNGVQVIGYNGVIKAKLKLNMAFGSTNIITKAEFLKNGSPQPGHASAAANGYLSLISNIDVVAGDIITVTLTRVSNTSSITLDGMNSTLSFTIPTSALARGPEGSPGTPGWSWRSGFGAPSAGLGVNQDVYLNKTTMDLYEKISGTWTLQVNIKGDVGPAGSARTMIFAERNGTLANNTDNWAFGSGSTTAGKYLTMMSSGRVTKLSFHAVTAGSTVKTIEIMKNGSSSGQSITIPANVGNGFSVLITPVTFAAGDLIGFRTVLAGGASQARIAAEIELD